MTPQRDEEVTLRPGRLEFSRLGWALLLSLLLHLGGYGGYKLGQTFNVWQRLELPSWLKPKEVVALEKKSEQEMPLIFVDVNPAVATVEPPKNSKFYSDKNSQAANPDTDKETGQPKITGTQTDFVKAEDVPRSPFDRLQPTAPPPVPEQPQENPKPTIPAGPGDLAMGRSGETLQPDPGTAERPRPRKIAEAQMRQNRNQLAGQKMKQEGGVRPHSQLTALDATATSFGIYDMALISAIEQRWFDLLDAMSYDGYRYGKVVLQFHLSYDGRVTDVKVVENNVGESLCLRCQKAILDPAPFDRWPRDLRLLVDKEYREIQIAFYYN